jgi:hypothetical protein
VTSGSRRTARARVPGLREPGRPLGGEAQLREAVCLISREQGDGGKAVSLGDSAGLGQQRAETRDVAVEHRVANGALELHDGHARTRVDLPTPAIP